MGSKQQLLQQQLLQQQQLLVVTCAGFMPVWMRATCSYMNCALG